ncbi:MAG TPA: hypothetical protein VM690_01345 [Gaiellaceae bacterium]|nr:hypothetical protein [Gaiellaceae bacterium]
MIDAVPPHSTFVDVWGQPSRSAEIAGRPLASTLYVFRSGKTVRIPLWHGQPLAPVAKTMRAGSLVPTKAREVGALYLVPTTLGGLCIQGPTFQTCHRGLLRAGVTYGFQADGSNLLVFGVAADDVARVSLGGQVAAVHDNVFILSRPLKLTSTAHLPKTFGTLTVWYRNGGGQARVSIR